MGLLKSTPIKTILAETCTLPIEVQTIIDKNKYIITQKLEKEKLKKITKKLLHLKTRIN